MGRGTNLDIFQIVLKLSFHRGELYAEHQKLMAQSYTAYPHCLIPLALIFLIHQANTPLKDYMTLHAVEEVILERLFEEAKFLV